MGYAGVGKGGQQVGNVPGSLGNVGTPPGGSAHLHCPPKEEEIFTSGGFE